MGAWGVGITSNDLAQDLKSEYEAVFSTVSPEEGVAMLDHHVREVLLEGQEDDETWADYVYSLADFLWRHGMLTQEVRDRALGMIADGDRDDRYREAGLGPAREKTLAAFSEKLKMDQPKLRKPRIHVNRKLVFQVGDVLAVQLCTTRSAYYPSEYLTEEELRACDGHWILMRKVWDDISWHSKLVPAVRDIWPVFELGRSCVPEKPKKGDWSRETPVGIFCGDGTMALYRRRGAQLIENCLSDIGEVRMWNTALSLSGFDEQAFLVAQRRGRI